MIYLFTILLLVAPILLIAGLINPRWVLVGNNKSRKLSSALYLSLFLFSFVTVAVLAPKATQKTSLNSSSTKPVEGVGEPTYPAVASPSPKPQVLHVGFDQNLDQFQNAYSKLEFGDDQNPFDYQVNLYPKDNKQSCEVIGWRMPDDKNLRGVTVSIKQWTPVCSEALKLAMTNLTPTLDYDKLYPRISSAEFVREVDSKDGGITLRSEGDTKLEVLWIDNNSYCPIGQCNLSFQFQLKDTTELSANTSPSVSSVESESITTTQQALLTANEPDSRINLRNSPSTTSKNLGYGLPGDRVQVIERTNSEGYDWFQVKFPRSGVVGWIRGDFVSTGTAQESSETPVTESPVTESPTPAVGTPIRAAMSGRCQCPYDTDSRGRSCGGRSAYSRPGGEAPQCYVGDTQ